MKVVTTPILKKMVASARAKQFNRTMTKVVEKNLDPAGKHVLSQPFIHGDVQCIRCAIVLCKMKDREEPYQGVLDFTIEDYNKIPEYEVQDDT